MSTLPEPESFLSGESGTIGGRRARSVGRLRDAALDLAQALARTGPRLDRLAQSTPSRKVLVTGCYRAGPANRLPRAMPRLGSVRHDVRFAFGAIGDAEPALAAHTVRTQLAGGKLENVNAALERSGLSPAGFDWTVVIDDDVVVAPRFLDRFVAVCEALGFDLAQPAQTHLSHAAWRVVRRRPGAVARETNFVEIGPVSGFSRRAAAALLPYPDLSMGWGLDAHWAAEARERGFRLGVVDSLPVRHEARPAAVGYSREQAIEQARRFLADRPYVTTQEGRRTLATHGRVPRAGGGARPPAAPQADGPLRILVVPKWYPWPERPVFGLFCREHAGALATRHDVVVLASLATRSPPFRGFELCDAVEGGIRTLRVRYRRPLARPAAMGFQLAGMLAASWRLRRAGWRPDVVHAHVYSAALPALVLARLSGAPLVVTEHYTGFARGLVTGYERKLARFAFERADLVAPVSADLAAQLRAVAPRARIQVHPNVVDTAVFSPGPHRPNDPRRLLAVGALAEKKGHAYLLDALAAMGGLTLDLVGDGELRAQLEAQAARLGLGARVRFRGELEQQAVAEMMATADLLVLPSLHETFGCTLIEAMASGLPAVATRVGGVPEVLPAAAGELVEPRNPAALAAAIERALERAFDPEALARTADELYGRAAFAGRWSETYAAVTARHR